MCERKKDIWGWKSITMYLDIKLHSQNYLQIHYYYHHISTPTSTKWAGCILYERAARRLICYNVLSVAKSALNRSLKPPTLAYQCVLLLPKRTLLSSPNLFIKKLEENKFCGMLS